MDQKGVTREASRDDETTLPQPYVVALRGLAQACDELDALLAQRQPRVDQLKTGMDELERGEVRFRPAYLSVISARILTREQNEAAVNTLERSRILTGRAGRLVNLAVR